MTWALSACLAVCSGASAVDILRLPDGALQPQAVSEPGGTIHLAWLQGDPKAADVFLWTLPGGRTNGPPPVQINRIPGSAVAIGTIRGVQMVLGREGWVHLVWNGSSSSAPAAGATPLWYARHRDASRGAGSERNLVGGTRQLDGGASVAADVRGRVHVVWHGAAGGGADGEESRRVFRALSADDGATFAPEEPLGLDPGVCACCSLRALADRDGGLWLLYRAMHVAGDRPMALVRSAADGAPWEPVMTNPWPASQCPMSSGCLTSTSGGVLAAWETRGTIQVSPFPLRGVAAPVVAIPALGKRARHPVVVVNDRGDGLCVWSEGTGWQRGGAVSWQELDPSGRPIGSPTAAAGLAAWNAPAAFCRPDGSWVVVY